MQCSKLSFGAATASAKGIYGEQLKDFKVLGVNTSIHDNKTQWLD